MFIKSFCESPSYKLRSTIRQEEGEGGAEGGASEEEEVEEAEEEEGPGDRQAEELRVRHTSASRTRHPTPYTLHLAPCTEGEIQRRRER